MNHEFDYDLLKEDWDAIRNAFTGFFKSFGPSPTQYSFKDEMKIKFGLWKVNMGPVKLIKLVISLIAFILWFFLLFLNADIVFKILFIVLFILFYGWLWENEIEAEIKDEKAGLDKHTLTLYKGITSLFAKTEEKKK